MKNSLVDFVDAVNEAMDSLDESTGISLNDICHAYGKTVKDYDEAVKKFETEGVSVVYGNFCEKLYYSSEDKLYHGKMKHESVRDLITFGGSTYSEALDDFAAAIDEYIDEGPCADDWEYNSIG